MLGITDQVRLFDVPFVAHSLALLPFWLATSRDDKPPESPSILPTRTHLARIWHPLGASPPPAQLAGDCFFRRLGVSFYSAAKENGSPPSDGYSNSQTLMITKSDHFHGHAQKRSSTLRSTVAPPRIVHYGTTFPFFLVEELAYYYFFSFFEPL